MKAKEYFHKRLEQIRMRKRDNVNQISCYADDVYKIMEDYAKQEAIEFLKWSQPHIEYAGNLDECYENMYQKFKDES